MRFLSPNVWKVFLFVLFLASLVGLFASGDDLAKTFSFLFSALTKLYSFLAAAWHRPLLFILVVLVIVVGFLSYQTRNVPLSVIATDIMLSYQDNDETILKVDGAEWFRTNLPNVSARYMTLSPSDGYSIPENQIKCWLERPSEADSENQPLKFGSQNNGWECIHEFNSSLPYNWFTWVISFIPWISMRLAAIRRFTYIFCWEKNPYDQVMDYYQFRAVYPIRSLTISVEFKKPINKENIKARVIRAYAVENITPSPVQGHALRFRVTLKGMEKEERLRISWPLQRD